MTEADAYLTDAARASMPFADLLGVEVLVANAEDRSEYIEEVIQRMAVPSRGKPGKQAKREAPKD